MNDKKAKRLRKQAREMSRGLPPVAYGVKTHKDDQGKPTGSSVVVIQRTTRGVYHYLKSAS